MEKWYINRTNEDTTRMIKKVNLSRTSDAYREKAFYWIQHHNCGKILKGECVDYNLELTCIGTKGRGESHQVDLRTGSISTVHKDIEVLLNYDVF